MPPHAYSGLRPTTDPIETESVARKPPRLLSDARVLNVVQRIENDPSDHRRLHELAAASGLSPYHLHRVFVSTMGETIGSYVRRQRLAAAARHLRETDDHVQSIAVNVGYGSLAAFSRAFARQFGVAPTAYRNRERTRIPPLQSRHHVLARRVRIATPGALSLVGLRFHGHYRDADAYWAIFAALLREHGTDHDGMQAYAVIRDHPAVTPDGLIRYDCCILDPGLPATLPAPLIRQRVPATHYAALEHRGPYWRASAAYRAIIRVWMPRHGKRPDAVPGLERFLEPPWAPRVRGEQALTLMVPLR